MAESALYSPIILATSRGPTRIFRFNSGLAFAGKVVQQTDTSITLSPFGRVRLAPPGFGDLGGLTMRTITQEDVGKVAAIYVGIEVKTGTKKAKETQDSYLAMVKEFGGISGVARSVEDARQIIECDARWPLRK